MPAWIYSRISLASGTKAREWEYPQLLGDGADLAQAAHASLAPAPLFFIEKQGPKKKTFFLVSKTFFF